MNFVGNDIQQSDVYDQLRLYITTGDGGGGGGIRPLPGPIFEPMLVDQPVPLEGEPAVLAEEVPAPAPEPVAKGSRKKRSIWWPGGGGGWADIGVSFSIKKV